MYLRWITPKEKFSSPVDLLATMLFQFGKDPGSVCTDKSIFAGLRHSEGPAFERAIECLYEQCYPNIQRQLVQMGATEADADDVFQDALLVLIRNSKKEQFVLTTTACGYLFAIARNILRNKWRDHPAPVEWQDTFVAGQPPELELAEKEAGHLLRQQLLAACLALLGEQCRLILADTLAGISMQEIAEKYGLKNEHVARQTKLRCVHQLKECVRKKWNTLD